MNMNETKMVKPIAWKDIVFTLNKYYTINTAAEIKPISDDNKLTYEIYYSSNGYNYALLKTIDGRCNMFPIDAIMVWTFKKEEMIRYIPKYRIIHLDGDNRNNNIDNLQVVSDDELWRDVTLPEIRKNEYEVSNWGNVRFKSNGKLKTIFYNSDKDGYPVVNLTFDTHDGAKYKNVKLHRVIAFAFIDNPDPENMTSVNHINGNKTDNTIMNLEWIDDINNSKHASLTGLYNSQSRLTTEDIDMVIELLIQCNGSIKETLSKIDKVKYPYITYPIITGIKQKKSCYIKDNSRYDLMNINFKSYNNPLTTNEIDMVIEALLKYDGNVMKVVNSIDTNIHPGITRWTVSEIRNKKKKYYRSDSKYNLDSINFNRRGTYRITSDDVDYAIDMLLKYGTATEVMKHIDKEKYPYLTLGVIKMIKYKEKTYVNLAKRYDLNLVEFKSYREK